MKWSPVTPIPDDGELQSLHASVRYSDDDIDSMFLWLRTHECRPLLASDLHRKSDGQLESIRHAYAAAAIDVQRTLGRVNNEGRRRFGIQLVEPGVLEPAADALREGEVETALAIIQREAGERLGGWLIAADICSPRCATRKAAHPWYCTLPFGHEDACRQVEVPPRARGLHRWPSRDVTIEIEAKAA
jgi:hypothetical protein